MFKFFKGWLRKLFCKQEVHKGQILVLWRDVDDVIYGWNVNADNEKNLNQVSRIIKRAKVRKLERTVCASGHKKREDGCNTIFPL